MSRVPYDTIRLTFAFVQKYTAAADITESLSEDQVPEAFLVMLLIQFGTMIVDRALYLKKSLLGKCVFQVVLVFGIHFWMFFILPGVTERCANDTSSLIKPPSINSVLETSDCRN